MTGAFVADKTVLFHVEASGIENSDLGMATREDNDGCDAGEEAKSAKLILLSMYANVSAMPGAFVADMMAVFDGDASGKKNTDLAKVTRLVDELFVCIIGPCPFEAQMQGSLVHPMTDLPLNLCLKRATMGDATRAIRQLLGRQISSGADPPL